MFTSCSFHVPLLPHPPPPTHPPTAPLDCPPQVIKAQEQLLDALKKRGKKDASASTSASASNVLDDASEMAHEEIPPTGGRRAAQLRAAARLYNDLKLLHSVFNQVILCVSECDTTMLSADETLSQATESAELQLEIKQCATLAREFGMKFVTGAIVCCIPAKHLPLITTDELSVPPGFFASFNQMDPTSSIEQVLQVLDKAGIDRNSVRTYMGKSGLHSEMGVEHAVLCEAAKCNAITVRVASKASRRDNNPEHAKEAALAHAEVMGWMKAVIHEMSSKAVTSWFAWVICGRRACGDNAVGHVPSSGCWSTMPQLSNLLQQSARLTSPCGSWLAVPVEGQQLPRLRTPTSVTLPSTAAAPLPMAPEFEMKLLHAAASCALGLNDARKERLVEIEQSLRAAQEEDKRLGDMRATVAVAIGFIADNIEHHNLHTGENTELHAWWNHYKEYIRDQATDVEVADALKITLVQQAYDFYYDFCYGKSDPQEYHDNPNSKGLAKTALILATKGNAQS